jgi:3-oxoacyl-[acyl-carrier protein] reductase
MAMPLTGKISLVTGGAQGIGQAIATTLAQEGSDVVVADLDANRCEETVARVQQLGRKAMAVSVNVGDWDQVKGMIDRVLKDWERIDILVNNAGITRDGLLLRMKEEDWQSVLQVNLTGLDCWSHRQHWSGQLRRIEGGSHRPHQNRRTGICQSQYYRQCSCTGIY